MINENVTSKTTQTYVMLEARGQYSSYQVCEIKTQLRLYRTIRQVDKQINSLLCIHTEITKLKKKREKGNKKKKSVNKEKKSEQFKNSPSTYYIHILEFSGHS